MISLATRRPRYSRWLARWLKLWPGDVSRRRWSRAFRAKHADGSASHARLLVEIGRLRAELHTLADVSATKQGFALAPRRACWIVVLAPPVEEPHAEVLAFLADGRSWSSSALAIRWNKPAHGAAGARPAWRRRKGAEVDFGHGGAARWMTPLVPGFPTILLLPGPLPSD